MTVPTARAPITAPRKAPTIPCQKRSGRKTVKCQRAIPIVNQTSRAISRSPPSLSVPPVFAPRLAPRPPLGVFLAPLGRGFLGSGLLLGRGGCRRRYLGFVAGLTRRRVVRRRALAAQLLSFLGGFGF